MQVLDLDGEFGQLDLAPVRAIGHGGQALIGALASVAHRLEAFRAGARGLELFPVGRIHGLLGQSDILCGVGDDSGEPTEHLQIELEGFTPLGGLGALQRAALETRLNLPSALLNEATALGELRLATAEHGGRGLGLLAKDLDARQALVGLRLASRRVGDGPLENWQGGTQFVKLRLQQQSLGGGGLHFVTQSRDARRGVVHLLLQPSDLSITALEFGLGLGQCGGDGGDALT